MLVGTVLVDQRRRYISVSRHPASANGGTVLLPYEAAWCISTVQVRLTDTFSAEAATLTSVGSVIFTLRNYRDPLAGSQGPDLMQGHMTVALVRNLGSFKWTGQLVKVRAAAEMNHILQHD
jgi:hypothetical protein